MFSVDELFDDVCALIRLASLSACALGGHGLAHRECPLLTQIRHSVDVSNERKTPANSAGVLVQPDVLVMSYFN